jgi:hypothetical protein
LRLRIITEQCCGSKNIRSKKNATDRWIYVRIVSHEARLMLTTRRHQSKSDIQSQRRAGEHRAASETNAAKLHRHAIAMEASTVAGSEEQASRPWPTSPAPLAGIGRFAAIARAAARSCPGAAAGQGCLAGRTTEPASRRRIIHRGFEPWAAGGDLPVRGEF